MTTSPPRDPDLAEELERLAVELAAGAAGVVRVHSRRALGVSSKSTATDLVTETDRASERWLVERIRSVRPDDAILGEEGTGSPGTSGVGWVVDPIDGTVNYVLGLPHYGVSVAVKVDGQVVAGAVCNVGSGEMFRAGRGRGAYLDDVRLTGPRDVPLARAVVGTGFSYSPEQRTRQGAVVAQLLPLVADIRRFGSASLDLCAVAAGRLDGYFEAGLHEWDYAAGVLIAEEAGCVATGLRGSAASSQMTAVAGTASAAEFVSLLERLDADLVSS